MKIIQEQKMKVINRIKLTIDFGMFFFICGCFILLVQACDFRSPSKSVTDSEGEQNMKQDTFSIMFDKVLGTPINVDSNYQLLVDSFIHKSTPNATDYCFLLRFIMVNVDESINEQAALEVFENLKQNKPKRDTLEYYLSRLSESKITEIRSKVIQFLCIELAADGYDSEKSIKTFYGFEDSASIIATRECLGGLAQ